MNRLVQLGPLLPRPPEPAQLDQEAERLQAEHLQEGHLQEGRRQLPAIVLVVRELVCDIGCRQQPDEY